MAIKMQRIQAGKKAPATSMSGSQEVHESASAMAYHGLRLPRAMPRCLSMLAARATGWIALAVSLAGCVELPWRSYAAAPPGPAQMAANATSETVFVPAWLQALDEAHEYALVELIDIAERISPETRGA